MNNEMEILQNIRKEILTCEEFVSLLFCPAIHREEEDRNRQRHIHDQLELRFLFIPPNNTISPFSRLEQICLTPPDIPHLTLCRKDLERHMTIRLSPEEIFFMKGSSNIQVFDISKCKFPLGVDIRELVFALEKAGRDGITDTDHLRILIAMVFSAVIFITGDQSSSAAHHPAELIAAYIRANFFRNDLSIQEIASKTNFSANYIQTVFRDRWNCTPIQYLNEIRLKNARSLLQKHQYQVKEVASLCGWNYTHYFCKKYKEFFGHSPAEEP